MQIDAMVGPIRWNETAALARRLEGAGFTGITFTDVGGQTPWINIATAATAAPTLNFTTGIAVAFPMSPMIAAGTAWELAGNTEGRFRLGLGSQIKAHIERRYGVEFEPPGGRMKSYLLAVKDVLAAFRGGKLDHHSTYWDLTLLPDLWRPPAHDYGDIKVDVSAVGPWMCAMAGEIADGIHVHPLHSMHYLRERLLPAVAEGEKKAGRTPGAVDLLIPVFIAPGDTPEERAFLTGRARRQIAFYGSTPNYSFQFDDLGFEGTTDTVRGLLRDGDLAGMEAAITDEMLEHYAVVGPWDTIADTLLARYGSLAERVVSYLTFDDLERNPDNLGRWGEIARAVRSA
ncbi:MAG: TIGR03617 family F420-dependent LLM class oxidoreductase [Sporichthyaceae bacterium]